MRDAIAVLNAGSSSVKFALFLLRPKRDRMRRDPVLLLRGQIERIGQQPELHVRGGRNLSFEGPPAAQVAEQTPAEHTVPALQMVPHAPQLLALLCRFTHTPAQSVRPAWHWHAPAWHS